MGHRDERWMGQRLFLRVEKTHLRLRECGSLGQGELVELQQVLRNVRAVANIALEVRDVLTENQTTDNEKWRTSAKKY